MKYFTIDWYERSQKTSYHLSLEEDVQAETFSEEYFQKLYKDELTDWLDMEEEVASILSQEENIAYEPFNKDRAIQQFEEGFVYNQEDLKYNLPEEILHQIADIRVFTLNKASRKVIDDVTRYCEENEKLVMATIENYDKYLEANSNRIEKEIVEKFGFHDCVIKKSVSNGNSFTLLLDNSGGFTNINEVTFENFNIVTQDDSIEDTWWLYEEVYKLDDSFEFHILLQNKDMDLIDFIINAERVSFKVKNKL
ncbi:DUF4085 family protein [Oceanobacillus sp. CAU 1775]